jgi:hypothetical protein
VSDDDIRVSQDQLAIVQNLSTSELLGKQAPRLPFRLAGEDWAATSLVV